LQACSNAPLTGFFRNGCCDTSDDDLGSHTVCTQVTKEFLEFSVSCGNDLVTPGDRWCVCAARWKQAYDAGKAAPVYLAGTHEGCLEYVPFEALVEYALDKQ
jgi:uncharacterized protein (DUF2237 family)